MENRMKACHCCGVKQSGVDGHNSEYENLVRLILESGDERQLLSLIDIMREKITTCVRTSFGEHKLAYPEKELWHMQVIKDAAQLLIEKLKERQPQ